MTEPLLASSSGADRWCRRPQARDAGFSGSTPIRRCRWRGSTGFWSRPPSRVRVVMAAAGFAAAAGVYALQWWSAVAAYPINSGGRPLHSWPVFPLIAFEVGVLAAAVGRLPRSSCGKRPAAAHHPLFAVDGFDRASQDRFFLAVATDGRGWTSWRRSLTPGGRAHGAGAGAVMRAAVLSRPCWSLWRSPAAIRR